MTADRTYPRFAETRLLEALADTPVVLIHGPRQCGKTTLAQAVGRPRGDTYFTFDDEVTCAAATADPMGFVTDLSGPAIFDEVQRVPGIFAALKSAVDRRRVPVDIADGRLQIQWLILPLAFGRSAGGDARGRDNRAELVGFVE